MMRLLLIASLMVLSAGPALAADGAPAKTGLPGTTWANDCTTPASASNYYLLYSVASDGNLVETRRSRGKDTPRRLRNIQLISESWLLYTLDDTDGEAVNILTFTAEDGRKKSWWSVGHDGKAYIRDGKFTDSGEPPWFKRCK